jgi:hypothetical protein
MSLDAESLRRHYASLTTEALSELNPDDLIPEARAIVIGELSRRPTTSSPLPDAILSLVSDDPPPWFATAALACSYGNRGAHNSPEALDVIKYLNAAGVPTCLRFVPTPSDGSDVLDGFLIYVPGHLNIKAASVLDVNVFNAKEEAEWRRHLASVAENELPDIAPDIVCAGMQDRIERFTRAYDEELARRGLPARSTGG